MFGATQGAAMLGKTKGMILAYLPPLLWVVGGFALAEVLRWLAVSTSMHWLATVATWSSLLVLLAATARALWVSWRLWRNRVVPPPPDGAI
jgi:hypothetical protein